jgi:rare lipoprotein A
MRWAIFLCIVLLSACATPRGGYYADDGPGPNPPDVANIPDAVPRAEPLAATGNQPYSVYGREYVPVANARGYRERGVASWYGRKFHGRRTSSGEPYDMYAMTAAHKTLPLPSYARVTNLDNGRAVVVRVNDRGPFLHNRLIDLSYAAAARLGIAGNGTGLVEVEAIVPGEAPMVAQKPKVETFAIALPASKPIIEIIPSAQAAPVETPARATPTAQMYVQAGAFREWDHAAQLRARLEREAFQPVFIQSVMGAGETRLYRVRIGPVTSVEEGDRLTESLAAHGVTDALIVVE